MFINSGDIAHWNMEKLPILYNGNFRCHGNVCYVFRINPFFLQITSDRSKQYVNFEKNRLKIDDFRSQFRFFINSTISHWLTYKIMQISKWLWPWLWPLTLTVWRNIYMFLILKSRDVKTWRRTSKRRVTYRSAILLQPTRSLLRYFGWRLYTLCFIYCSAIL